jgi:regulator of sigma E protease
MERDETGDLVRPLLGAGPVVRPTISAVSPGPAQRAGFQPDDVIVALNGVRGLTASEITSQIRAQTDTPLTFTLEREGRTLDIAVTPEGPAGDKKIQVGIQPFEYRAVDLSLVQATQLSISTNWANTKLIGRTLRGLFTRETSVTQLSGPVEIARLSGQAADAGWIAVFQLMAIISLNLGLLNLMPVPVLDGGHIAILAVEGLARRDLSLRVKERILMAGAALIVLLMVTVIYNDIARLMR